MIGQMAIAITLSGFNDVRRSVTLLFLLMDHFIYDFLRLPNKRRKSIDYRFEFFLQMPIEFLSF